MSSFSTLLYDLSHVFVFVCWGMLLCWLKLPLKCWRNNNTKKRCVLSALLIFVNLTSLEYLIFILVIISSITSKKLFAWGRRMILAMQRALLWNVNSHYLLIFLLHCLPFSHQYVRVLIQSDKILCWLNASEYLPIAYGLYKIFLMASFVIQKLNVVKFFHVLSFCLFLKKSSLSKGHIIFFFILNDFIFTFTVRSLICLEPPWAWCGGILRGQGEREVRIKTKMDLMPTYLTIKNVFMKNIHYICQNP